MRDIGKNIKDLRIRKSMTQDELAEKLFVTRQTVSNYETGKSRPDIDMLERIAAVLETDIQQLLYGPAPTVEKEKLRRLVTGAALTFLLAMIYLALEPMSNFLRTRYYIRYAYLPCNFLERAALSFPWLDPGAASGHGAEKRPHPCRLGQIYSLGTCFVGLFYPHCPVDLVHSSTICGIPILSRYRRSIFLGLLPDIFLGKVCIQHRSGTFQHAEFLCADDPDHARRPSMALWLSRRPSLPEKQLTF